MEVKILEHTKSIEFCHFKDDNQNGSDFFSHMHNDYELFYFIQGDADFMAGSKTYHLKPNDIVLVKPTDIHRLILRSNAPHERIIISFNSDDFEQSFEEKLKNINSYYSNSPAEVIAILANLARLKQFLNEEELAYCIYSSIKQLIIVFSHMEKEATKEAPISTLDKIIGYINDHLEEEINVEKLSRLFYVSESWINHAFKKSYGMAIKTYINNRKILSAQQQIQSGKNINDVVVQFGYENYSTFFRQYKKFLKRNPMEDKSH